MSIETSKVQSVYWKTGDKMPLFFRPGSSDLGLIYDIAIKPGSRAEYWLPDFVAPKVILDIGANIGITARYLAHRFPDAKVICFEPVEENFTILKLNIENFPNIRAYNFGLGNTDIELDVVVPTGSDTNKGGFSMHSILTDGPKARVIIRNATSALDELNISHADLIKIDTEGAEHDILTSMPVAFVREAKWIFGELHSEGLRENTSFRVLDFLSQSHMIGVNKSVSRKNFHFDAVSFGLSSYARTFRRK